MPLGSLFSMRSCRYCKRQDEGLQSLTLHLCQNLQEHACHWDLSSACAYISTVTDDDKAPTPDFASLLEASGPHAIGTPSQLGLMAAL